MTYIHKCAYLNLPYPGSVIWGDTYSSTFGLPLVSVQNKMRCKGKFCKVSFKIKGSLGLPLLYLWPLTCSIRGWKKKKSWCKNLNFWNILCTQCQTQITSQQERLNLQNMMHKIKFSIFFFPYWFRNVCNILDFRQVTSTCLDRQKNTMPVNVSSQLQDSVSTEECRMTTSLHRIKVVLGESTPVSLNHVGFKCKRYVNVKCNLCT